MKKILPLILTLTVLIGCKKGDDPKPLHKIVLTAYSSDQFYSVSYTDENKKIVAVNPTKTSFSYTYYSEKVPDQSTVFVIGRVINPGPNTRVAAMILIDDEIKAAEVDSATASAHY